MALEANLQNGGEAIDFLSSVYQDGEVIILKEDELKITKKGLCKVWHFKAEAAPLEVEEEVTRWLIEDRTIIVTDIYQPNVSIAYQQQILGNTDNDDQKGEVVKEELNG